MLDVSHPQNQLPVTAGVGFKPQHFADLCRDPGPVRWIEVHAENYMGDGGRPHAQLRALTEKFPLSVHGVGLSIGGDEPLDPDHLNRLKTLMEWAKPCSFSEHLAWSTHDGAYLNDLLPLPYTEPTLTRVAAHIDQVQNHLGRQMLLENPSSYLTFDDSTMTETDFVARLVAKTGCGLLLDVNNVFVSATNLSQSPHEYIDRFPIEAVREIHVGGHAHDQDDAGQTILIDSHANPADEQVWHLLQHTLARTGPLPVLVEWDTNVPDWPTLRTETERVAALLATVSQ